jgi:SAM-dependent methyltransferase
VRPVRSLVTAVMRAAPGLAPRAKKLLWRGFYELASLRRRNPETTLMNYGYAPMSPADETVAAGADRHRLELYAVVAGSSDLAGRDVLEVGCGRGGGTAFVADHFKPRSMTGLDLAASAIAGSRARYGRPGLEFVTGDAENLPFPDATFDAVLSVESTHCYPDVASFLREARRVLRPRGRLLLADLRHAAQSPRDGLEQADSEIERLRRQLRDGGFRFLEEVDITANVARALELDTPALRARIERRVPKPLQRHALAFAAVEGSSMHRAIAAGEFTYMRFVLERPAASPPGEIGGPADPTALDHAAAR